MLSAILLYSSRDTIAPLQKLVLAGIRTSGDDAVRRSAVDARQAHQLGFRGGIQVTGLSGLGTGKPFANTLRNRLRVLLEFGGRLGCLFPYLFRAFEAWCYRR